MEKIGETIRLCGTKYKVTVRIAPMIASLAKRWRLILSLRCLVSDIAGLLVSLISHLNGQNLPLPVEKRVKIVPLTRNSEMPQYKNITSVLLSVISHPNGMPVQGVPNT